MDEPFGALDAMTREEMNVELLRVWDRQHKTVVFVTHSIPEAIFLSDRVIVLSARPGRVIEDVRIDMARPRPLDIKETPQFGKLVQHIRGLLSPEPRGGVVP
jgi:NitT/TauT family transport system ATP-binding protein